MTCESAYKLTLASVAISLLLALSACTASGDPEEIAPTGPDSDSGTASSSSGVVESSSDADSSDVDEFDGDSLIVWVPVPAMTLTRGGVTYSVDGFKMTETEVTQGLYAKMMGGMPDQNYTGDNYPVENVNWFQAVLFCNEYSKYLGLDTAYTYTSIGDKNFLENLVIDYGVESIRLPTEMEWEIAAHGGTTTTYYWENEVASKYAYYGQSKGPVEVAGRLANAFDLYDMAGNVAEWVNDWYGAYPTDNAENYTGAKSGSYRVVRGGGWSDPIKECAPDVREKKDPLYASHMLGFRVVYSRGF